MHFLGVCANLSNSDHLEHNTERIRKIIGDGSSFRWFSRTRLPANRSTTDFSAWTFVKQCIGKDLTKISMPVVLNEPISFLQRVAEYLEYSELLQEAVKQSDPVRRMEYVCAFAVSATSSNFNRIGKPFNPLLGETYELHRDGFVFVAEQVSHHPPITAFHAESSDFRLWSTVQFRLRFWGKSIEVQPKGVVTLELMHPCRETYTWHNANLVVHNVLLGKIWIEHVGSMQVTNRSANLQADLEFHPVSWLFSQSPANQVTGRLIRTPSTQRQCSSPQSATNQPVESTSSVDLTRALTGIGENRSVCPRVIFGNWTRGLFSVDPRTWDERSKVPELCSHKIPDHMQVDQMQHGGSSASEGNPSGSASPLPPSDQPEFGFEQPLTNQVCLWLARPRSPNAANQYNFTSFTVTLNELVDELAGAKITGQHGATSYLPPTDCRFRPDIRALENGELDLAASEKSRLEERQRQVRRISSQPKTFRGSDSNRATSPLGKSSCHPDNKESQCYTVVFSGPPDDTVPGRRRRSPSCSSLSPVRMGPLWFMEREPGEWIFTGGYWKRDWSKCPDLY